MTSGNNIVPGKSSPMMDVNYTDPNALYTGWQVSEKDLVNYRDVERRGLQFLFSLARTAPSMERDSPLNKFVSVYQKNEEGDFVIVSMAANNPNDIRIMEMTNEYFGEQYDNAPEMMIQKVIEMADDSGMIRRTSEYGEYGKISLETAEDEHARFKENMNIETGEPPSSSKVVQHSPLAGKIAASLLTIAALPAGRQTNAPNLVGRLANIFKRRQGMSQEARMQMAHQNKMQQITAQHTGKAVIEEAKMGTAKDIAAMKTEAAVGIAQEKSSTERYKAGMSRYGAEDIARIKGEYGVKQQQVKGKYDVKKERVKSGILTKPEAFQKAASAATQVGSLSGAYSAHQAAQNAYSKKSEPMNYNKKLGAFPSVTSGSVSKIPATNVLQHPNLAAPTKPVGVKQPPTTKYSAPANQNKSYK